MFLMKLPYLLTILKILPVLIILIASLMFIKTRNFFNFYIIIMLFIDTVINRHLKHFFKVDRMSDGLFNSYDTIPCDIVETNSPSYAFPSGHSQSIFLLITFFSLFIVYDTSFTYKKGLILLMICLGILVGYSRLYIKCHTLFQVIVGSCIGSLLGFLFYKLYKKLTKL
jgi:membrane-associated phospholipid phosphatase